MLCRIGIPDRLRLCTSTAVRCAISLGKAALTEMGTRAGFGIAIGVSKTGVSSGGKDRREGDLLGSVGILRIPSDVRKASRESGVDRFDTAPLICGDAVLVRCSFARSTETAGNIGPNCRGLLPRDLISLCTKVLRLTGPLPEVFDGESSPKSCPMATPCDEARSDAASIDLDLFALSRDCLWKLSQ